MTRSTIEQLQLQETERHNKATESAGLLSGIGSLVGGIGKGLAGGSSAIGHFTGKVKGGKK